MSLLERFLSLPLPEARIALQPTPRREDARLLVADRRLGTLSHRRISDLPTILAGGDLLVFNRSKVRKALTWLQKPTGGRVELLWLAPEPGGLWRVFGETAKLRPGLTLAGAGAMTAVVQAVRGREAWLQADIDVECWLEEFGQMPLPPYIRKRRLQAGADATLAQDAERYQTTFAQEVGSIAAPTAGLHFSPEMLAELTQHGIAHTEIVLHVGPSTFTEFEPGEAAHVRVLPEDAAISAAAVQAIAAARARGNRVLAVGTTSARSLEGLWQGLASPQPAAGAVDLTIKPGYGFRWLDALLTNFHLPGTTLRLLVAAFAGVELATQAYEAAVAEDYRFYSYGDAMLVL